MPAAARLVVLFGLAVLAFAVLLLVSDHYFSPALALLADNLKLPPEIAGATFLAVGNGAPDLSTIVTGLAGGGLAGAELAVADVFGGGLFVSTVVVGVVVATATAVARADAAAAGKGYGAAAWDAAEEGIATGAVLRDVVVYLVAVVVLSIVSLDGRVHLWEAVFMLGCYLVYLAAIFLRIGVPRNSPEPQPAAPDSDLDARRFQ